MCIAVKHTDRLSSTLRNQVASPLLRLPAELRNRIYAYALAIDTPIRIAVNFSGGPTRLQATVEDDYLWQYKTFDRTFSIRRLSEIQTLTAACHQIRAETALLRYTVNDFAIEEIDLAHGLENLPKEVCEGVRVLWLGLEDHVWPEASVYWLRRLPRLEKVVVNSVWAGAGDIVRDAIRRYVGREIEVVEI
jgi:hypothetical protein